MSEDWKTGFKDRLVEILGPRGVISSDDELIAYECDALTGYRIKPVFVVLPETSGQVSQIVKLCYEQDVPYVPRGAGTGLSGGALPENAPLAIR